MARLSRTEVARVLDQPTPVPVANWFPAPWRDRLARIADTDWRWIEEIRFRVERPVAVYGDGRGRMRFVAERGLAAGPTGCPSLSPEDLDHIVELLADRSLYARQDELRHGYLTLPGGHRVGLAGRAVTEAGRVLGMLDWTGLNVRMARWLPGVAKVLIDRTTADAGPAPSVLLVGPPGAGKTTVLRDALRRLSEQGWRVVVVDERRELGAGVGPPGLHTDVLDGWPKADGLSVAIRALGPDVVVVDELGTEADAEGVRLARRSGVAVWASAHGRGRDDVERHPWLGRLLDERVFDWVVTLAAVGDDRIREVWRACRA
jgi:stage III sporulation protein AA